MKRKIGFTAVIVATLIVAVFWQNDLVRTLLGMELILIPVLLGLSIYLGRHLEAALVIPDRYVQKEQEFEVDVRLYNHSYLPAGTVPVSLSCKSRFSSLKETYTENAFVTPNAGSKLCFYMKTGYCGKLYFDIKNVKVMDYLRIFGCDCDADSKSMAVFVLPRIHSLDMTTVLGAGEAFDGSIYSKVKKGDDPSEVFDIRQYRQGDQFHSFHWKLTAKTGDYMVREYSLPMNETAFIYVDLSCEDKTADMRAKMDCFLEVLASVSWSMTNSSMRHYVIWWDASKHCVMDQLIESEEDTYSMLEQVCESGVYEDFVDVEALYDGSKGADDFNIMRLDMDGKFYHNGICVRKFTCENVDKELTEWEK